MGEKFPPISYEEAFINRLNMVRRAKKDPYFVDILKSHYANSPIDFIEDWAITYDPRVDTLKTMPFFLFKRQKELVTFITECVSTKESGLIEKVRDAGCTWIFCAVAVWYWLLNDGVAIGFGSRKEALVDRHGDLFAIFPKMRKLIDNLPPFLLPENFEMPYMKLINHDNGSTIIGESGDNIGRGGRTTFYVKDEAAFYERPESIEAALGDNTDVQFDLSSVHGSGNVFYRRRHAGEVWEPGKEISPKKTRVFIFDWRDHPHKTQEWYDARKAKAEDEGLSHVFAQEIDRDYYSSMEGILIQGSWVNAAIGADEALGIDDTGDYFAGFDVATGEGGDSHALAIMKGAHVLYSESWGNGDETDATHKVDRICNEMKARRIKYDSIGVGSTVKNVAKRSKTITCDFVPYSGADAVAFPDKNYIEGKKNKDMFGNKKAQDWWALRDRFKKTYERRYNGREYSDDEVIAIPTNLKNRDALISELSQVTYRINARGLIIIDKAPPGTKSPNAADALVMANSIEEVRRGPTIRRF
jgi:hypothetical protein